MSENDETSPVIKRTTTTLDYKLEKVIGEGTFGKVFLGRKDNNIYALKQIFLRDQGLPVTTIREIQLLKRLSHKNIISIIEIVVDMQDIYLVFPHMYFDLQRYIRDYKMDVFKIRYISCQIARGLFHMHSNSVIHRDLKSANILMDKNLNVKIGDFGMGRIINKSGVYSPGVVTLWYRAPELLLGATQYSYDVDIWSLGCIIMEMLLERAPFQGKTELNQLEMIISVCGSINEASFPNVSLYPDFSKYNLSQGSRRLKNLLAGFDEELVELISTMLEYSLPRPKLSDLLSLDVLNHDCMSNIVREHIEKQPLPGRVRSNKLFSVNPF